MSSAAIDAKPILLSDLLDSVEQGTAVLPAFQRDFDWSDTDVVSLLATLLCNWPASSLLLMTGRPGFFEVRGFEDGPELASEVRYVVLDGQQRLTALFKALRERGDSVFVLNATRLSQSEGSAEDIEECIDLVPRLKWRNSYDLVRQGREGLVPLYVLRSASDFFAWRDRVVEASPEKDRSGIGKLLADVYRTHLGRLNTYTFPSVLLDNDLPPEAVARIFERINRTGLRLSTFDLLVARVYEPGWNLREKWDTARRESEPISDWLGDDGLPIAQAISLDLEGDIRQPALLGLKAREIRDHWDAATEAVQCAVGELRRIGVPSPKWMPYRGLLLPIAQRAKRLGTSSLDGSHGQLASWFWARSFGMDYDVGSSTRIASDAKILARDEIDWLPDEFSIDRRILRLATRKKQSALWSAFLSLISSIGPHDLLTGELIEDPFEKAVPISLFSRSGGDDDSHLRVLGLVLMTRESARIFRRERGSSLARFEPSALASQFLPEGSVLEQLMDPLTFINWRLQAIEEHLRELSPVRIHWSDGEIE